MYALVLNRSHGPCCMMRIFLHARLQDRTGGDFTLYDFFDNIFAFSELCAYRCMVFTRVRQGHRTHPASLWRWNWEYSLGFDPFKLFDGLKSGQ